MILDSSDSRKWQHWDNDDGGATNPILWCHEKWDSSTFGCPISVVIMPTKRGCGRLFTELYFVSWIIHKNGNFESKLCNKILNFLKHSFLNFSACVSTSTKLEFRVKRFEQC